MGTEKDKEELTDHRWSKAKNKVKSAELGEKEHSGQPETCSPSFTPLARPGSLGHSGEQGGACPGESGSPPRGICFPGEKGFSRHHLFLKAKLDKPTTFNQDIREMFKLLLQGLIGVLQWTTRLGSLGKMLSYHNSRQGRD